MKKLLEISSFHTHGPKTTIIWDTEWDRHHFLSFWAIFCPFTPTNNTVNQNFEKVKAMHRDIFLHEYHKWKLHKCTINDNYLMYATWDMKCDRQCFVLLVHFLPFYPINPKNQSFEEMKILEEILTLTTCVLKIMIICYTLPGIWHVTDVIIFHFGYLLPLYPITAQKIKI